MRRSIRSSRNKASNRSQARRTVIHRTTNSSSVGRVEFGEERGFNGVKVFSATMVLDREHLGEKITAWIEHNPQCNVREVIVTQSSDEAFHCIAITVFYWEDVDAKRSRKSR